MDVLVVDDCLSLREMAKGVLEGSGYTAAFAANGREALDHLLQSGPPDVIVLDLAMPVMDGWIFRCHQRCQPGLDSIPVILLSAESWAQQSRRGCRCSGCVRASVEGLACLLMSDPVRPGQVACETRPRNEKCRTP